MRARWTYKPISALKALRLLSISIKKSNVSLAFCGLTVVMFRFSDLSSVNAFKMDLAALTGWRVTAETWNLKTSWRAYEPLGDSENDSAD